MNFDQHLSLYNGVAIPRIGFGTWQIPDGDVVIGAVKSALEYGYRHVDTAAIYRNETGVGRAIATSGVKRSDIFVTSKVWNADRGYETTLAAFQKTLERLGTNYLDLYLIHWPAVEKNSKDWQSVNAETWRAMEKLYREGKVRAIGVSNFLVRHLVPLMETATIKPMANQIEFHPGYTQQGTWKFCLENDILVEAWSPLGSGSMLSNLKLKEIAGRYNKSVAQICIKWCLQNGVLPLPKSQTPLRILENISVSGFEMTTEDINAINDMPYFGGSGLHPDK